MTTEQFTYWLQGFLELSENKTMNERQLKIVKDHIALVLKKETPTEPEAAPASDPRQLSFNFAKDNFKAKYLSEERPIDPVQTPLTC